MDDIDPSKPTNIMPAVGHSDAAAPLTNPAPSPVTQAETAAYNPGRPMTVAPKNPAVHLIVSVFLPGVGSMMNGDTGKGIAILLFSILCLFLFWLIIPIFVGMALWIWGMIDAYRGAQRWNLAHGIIS